MNIKYLTQQLSYLKSQKNGDVFKNTLEYRILLRP